ncbi:MAG: 16S rRNA (uracil(1498)-N(3))-methyltransferase [Elusimicrobiota bacterium]|nr:MAG: 16S rRNA (uracil(1498)-N(3))-methyltransferase [Elusimicrobiota bacterium]
MPQFLVAPDDVAHGGFSLKGPEAFHVVKVMRLGAGAELELFDGKGGRFLGVIDAVAADGTVTGKVSKTLAADAHSAAKVDLYLGLLKASHWDDALDKVVQLGVSAVIPLLTPRTVVLLHEVERAKSKQERWSRLVMAAAKQCGRADLPPVREPVQFRDAVRALKDKGLILVAFEGMKGSSAADSIGPALRSLKAAGGTPTVSVFIGPEGGFSDEEVELARAEGAIVFGLGPRILRAEAAAAAAVAAVQYELGGI